VGKTSHFLALNVNISKMARDTSRVTKSIADSALNQVHVANSELLLNISDINSLGDGAQLSSVVVSRRRQSASQACM